jgi:hypothetical protein
VHRNIVSTCSRLFQAKKPEDSPMLRRQLERSDLYLSQARSIDRYLRSKGWAEQMPRLGAFKNAQPDADCGGGARRRSSAA